MLRNIVLQIEKLNTLPQNPDKKMPSISKFKSIVLKRRKLLLKLRQNQEIKAELEGLENASLLATAVAVPLLPEAVLDQNRTPSISFFIKRDHKVGEGILNTRQVLRNDLKAILEKTLGLVMEKQYASDRTIPNRRNIFSLRLL